MTAITANFPIWPLNFIPKTYGQSTIAETTEKNAQTAEISETLSFSAKSPRERFTSQYLYIINECLTDDWDGYEATAVEINAIIQLIDFYINFIQSLDLPYPEITPEPDGQVALDWHGNNGAELSISFSGNEVFTYVYIDNNNRSRGVSKIDSFDSQIIKRLIHKTVTD